MKLASIEHQRAYRFVLTFQNGEVMESDLRDLVGQHVSEQALSTSRIDPDWGCLEFLDGQVDIEPRTLYRYARGETGNPITHVIDVPPGLRADLKKEEITTPCS
jgi:hypothetical protein